MKYLIFLLNFLLIFSFSTYTLANDFSCRQKAKAEALKVYASCIESSNILSKQPTKPKISDAKIKKILIENSINEYPGNCPCPYFAAVNGSRCGGRSAWSKSGGANPLCYDSDVTNEMVNAYRLNQ